MAHERHQRALSERRWSVGWQGAGGEAGGGKKSPSIQAMRPSLQARAYSRERALQHCAASSCRTLLSGGRLGSSSTRRCCCRAAARRHRRRRCRSTEAPSRLAPRLPRYEAPAPSCGPVERSKVRPAQKSHRSQGEAIDLSRCTTERQLPYLATHNVTDLSFVSLTSQRPPSSSTIAHP